MWGCSQGEVLAETRRRLSSSLLRSDVTSVVPAENGKLGDLLRGQDTWSLSQPPNRSGLLEALEEARKEGRGRGDGASGARGLSEVDSDSSPPSPVSAHRELPHRLHQALPRGPDQEKMLLTSSLPLWTPETRRALGLVIPGSSSCIARPASAQALWLSPAPMCLCRTQNQRAAPPSG